MKAVITHLLYAQAKVVIDFSPYASFDQFLTMVDVGVMEGAGEQNLSYRELMILAALKRMEGQDGLHPSLIHDHIRAAGDRLYSKAEYEADLEKLKRLGLVSEFHEAPAISNAALIPPVSRRNARTRQQQLSAPLSLNGATTAANHHNLDGGVSGSLKRHSTGVSFSGTTLSQSSLVGVNGHSSSSLSLPAASQPFESAPAAQPANKGKKRKVVESKNEEQSKKKSRKPSSYEKILQELSQIREETKELKKGMDEIKTLKDDMDEIKAQLSHISSRLAPSIPLSLNSSPNNFSQGMGFFRTLQSLSPQPLQRGSSLFDMLNIEADSSSPVVGLRPPSSPHH